MSPRQVLPRDTVENSILARYQALTVWKKGDQRAPNKPLLVLWAIGRCLCGQPRLAPYTLVEKELRMLLRQFGPPRPTIHTEAPFWRLQGDGIWEIDRPGLVRAPKGNPSEPDLRLHNIRGGLTKSDYEAFRARPALALQVADELVAKHFPYTLQDQVLDATSIALGLGSSEDPEKTERWLINRRRWRDPRFRADVLKAYGDRCAVCEFAGRLGDTPLAIEAAHIKWHQARGPDVVENGISLCSLHHDLFDSGAFTILPEDKVLVAGVVHGTGVEAALGQYHGAPLKSPPLEGFPRPHPKFLRWHQREVFKAAHSLGRSPA